MLPHTHRAPLPMLPPHPCYSSPICIISCAQFLTCAATHIEAWGWRHWPCAGPHSGACPAGEVLPVMPVTFSRCSHACLCPYYNGCHAVGGLLCLTHMLVVNVQIEKEVKAFARSSGRLARSCIVVGGAAMQEQKHDLRGGVEIVVATPGECDHMPALPCHSFLCSLVHMHSSDPVCIFVAVKRWAGTTAPGHASG